MQVTVLTISFKKIFSFIPYKSFNLQNYFIFLLQRHNITFRINIVLLVQFMMKVFQVSVGKKIIHILLRTIQSYVVLVYSRFPPGCLLFFLFFLFILSMLLPLTLSLVGQRISYELIQMGIVRSRSFYQMNNCICNIKTLVKVATVQLLLKTSY